ncbi:MAG: ribosome-associated translation inhibitor RaiA [Chloroflexi bacterium]|nr:ribosome-associated translation inhibitor RaiA [Chloroflexota bacterium]
MQLIIKGKNMEVSEALKKYVQKKIGKLDRYLPTIDEARVELSVEKAKSNQDRQVVQVTLRSNSTILRAEERSSDMLAAIDAVRDKLQRQIKRYKERPMRIRERARAAAAASSEEQAEELPPRIVRVKRFSVTPMDEEEAIEQMELLGHDFFIFYNPDTGSMNVLYRRKDGNYGLLQPELA